jgi:hypothetical protein
MRTFLIHKQKPFKTMTKKHFSKIALIIANSVSDKIDKSQKTGWESDQASRAYKAAASQIALDLADFLADENPAFDRARFLNACGII